MAGSGGPRGTRRTFDLGRYGRRVMVWGLAAVAVLVGLGAVAPQAASTVEVRLAASTTALTPEEQQMVALMDPRDRARYLLQDRIQEQARMAAQLADVQRARHEAAMSVIDNIR